MTENATKSSSEKLGALRAAMKQAGIDGYLVPRTDEWKNEYVPACAERLSWLTGFTGSAGTAVVGADCAVVHTDGRYELQVERELDPALFSAVIMKRQPEDFIESLKRLFPKGGKIGFDPRLHTPAAMDRFSAALTEAGIVFVPVAGNLIDPLWADRPAFPGGAVEVYPDTYAGRSSEDKRKAAAAEIGAAAAAAFVMTRPDSIAWLLNIRGSDVPHVPVVLSYAIVHEDGAVDWFVPPEKVTDAVRAHLGPQVRVFGFGEMEARLLSVAQAARGAGKALLLDPASATLWFSDFLRGAGVEVKAFSDPAARAKTVKNATEIALIREGHIRDGVALVKFWKWIAEEGPKGVLTESAAADRLLGFRREQDGFHDTSFDSIVGWNANGADIHYRVTDDTDATIRGDGLLLVDSGGQYPGATTDNTRTWAVGTPTPAMREMFTRVLKGHIAVASARFSGDTTGAELDRMARQFLNKSGRDFAHSTGHGVGSFLAVHESDIMIAPRGGTTFVPGHLISNEPGYYDREAGYGIRLENLILVEEVADCCNPLLRLRFNTVSLTPFDRALIDIDLLDSDEIAWLNAYHRTVYETLSPRLDEAHKVWLAAETAPLSRRPGGP